MAFPLDLSTSNQLPNIADNNADLDARESKADTKRAIDQIAIPANISRKALYDDNRVTYDLLRFPVAIVQRQSVQEILSQYTLMARNSVSNSTQCVVRLSPLHVNPWLGMYVNPNNSIVLSEEDPILPANVAEWIVGAYDVFTVDYNNVMHETAYYRPPLAAAYPNSGGKRGRRSADIEFIDASQVLIPNDRLAVLNFSPNEQSELEFTPISSDRNPRQLYANTSKDSGLCARNIRLALELSTTNNFQTAPDERASNKRQALEIVNRLRPGGGRRDDTLPDHLNDELTVAQRGATRPPERDDFYQFLRSSYA